MRMEGYVAVMRLAGRYEANHRVTAPGDKEVCTHSYLGGPKRTNYTGNRSPDEEHLAPSQRGSSTTSSSLLVR